MAEKKKQPLSLNERHNRLLQDLSASQSRPQSSIPPPPTGKMMESKVKLEGRRRLCKHSSRDSGYSDDVPKFSGIADFDSPSPDETKPSKIELEGCSIFGRDDDDDCEHKPTLNRPNFSEIIDFDSHPLGEKSSQGSTEAIASSRQNGKEEKKQMKVKVQGRRRLCKAPCTGDNDDGEPKKRTENDEPKFSGLSDFESSPPVENTIMDILNDLSSRLETLSIKKRQAPKTVDWREDSSVKFFNEVKNQQKEEELLGFTSAASSFSLSSEPSDSSSGATDESRVRAGVNTLVNGNEEANDILSDSEGKIFVGRVNKIKNFGGKSVCTGQSIGSNVAVQEEDDDDDEDCVVLSQRKVVKEAKSGSGKFGQLSDDSDEVDVLDDYGDDSVSGDDDSITLKGPKSMYKLPGKISKMLYPHQRDGLKWLWSLHCQGKGGILGDDMGLGKTMQICGFLSGLFHSSLIKRALIVAPKTLLPHWIKELSTVGLSEKTREYFGTCAKSRQYELQYILQDKGVLLTTYDIVRNNRRSLCGDYYFHDNNSEDEIIWDYMILDEGHLIKNPSTQRAKSLLEIPCAHRIIISGTPIQNNLKELWALFNFCCPELLGDKNWFKDKYEYFILRGNEKNASDREKCIGSTVAKDLRERIQPYFLRRLKSEVFHEDDSTTTVKLSKKNEIIVWLRLTSCQRQLYEAFLNSELVLSAFDGSPLAALTDALYGFSLKVNPLEMQELKVDSQPIWPVNQHYTSISLEFMTLRS
ncbi:unnamed protein product [Ilex paraguariensis]|uniref:Helicase ATP-binding domain-containing protein n=1 Tax=Ilex paraguariensis TaxID=185542 RepID=A0ABC8TIH2_9AQUA